jgi:hypothetical protein
VEPSSVKKQLSLLLHASTASRATTAEAMYVVAFLGGKRQV